MTEWQPPHMLNPNGPLVRFEVWHFYRSSGGRSQTELARGFVSDERFARSGDQVIKRTNRESTKKWRSLENQSV